MPWALVTGTQEHLGPGAAALGRAGFDVAVWETADPPTPDGPFDCYLQLPCGLRHRAAGGRMAAPDLVCRIDALAAVAGRLRPNASVILALEDGEATAPEPPALPADLLIAVALALLEDLGRPAARVAAVEVALLCRQPIGERLDAIQWEMPTPPLVSAP
jgi:hypothetical protein